MNKLTDELAQKTEILDSVTRNQIAKVEANSIQSNAPTPPLNPEERALLKEHETTIKKGLQQFHDVGMAFADIRDRRLYREHGTFDEYCKDVWGVSRGKAYRYMAAAKCVQNLECRQLATNENLAIPATESQVRKMAMLDPDQQVEVAKKVAKKTSKPTAKDFDDEADSIDGEDKPMVKCYDIRAEAKASKPGDIANKDVVTNVVPVFDTKLVSLAELRGRVLHVYNICANPGKKQEALNIISKLMRDLDAWVAWEKKQLKQEAA